MNPRLSLLALPALPLAVALGSALPIGPEAAPAEPAIETPAAARLIRAHVELDGKTLLRGSASDDGRMDADGVWAYLKHIKFEPQEAFAAHVAKSKEEGAVVLKAKDRTIELFVAYGGLAKTRELRIEQVPGDGPKRWRVARAEIAQEAPYRWITRTWAAQLNRQRLPRKR